MHLNPLDNSSSTHTIVLASVVAIAFAVDDNYMNFVNTSSTSPYEEEHYLRPEEKEKATQMLFDHYRNIEQRKIVRLGEFGKKKERRKRGKDNETQTFSSEE